MQIVVTDSESALITQAVIKLKNIEGSLIKEIITNKSLDFIIHSLKEGDYVLEIQSVGFKPLIKNINLKAGQNILKLKLEIEEIKVDVKS